MEPVYIIGHKNPDTDSICSAIAYAFLKNTQAEGHIPARLGVVNRETQFVLDSFEVPAPLFLPHIHVRVRDVMTATVITASDEATVRDVGELMREHEVHAIPIVDAGGRARGVVTERNLARNYLRELELEGFEGTQTDLRKVAHTLDGRLVAGDPGRQVSGRAVIGAMSPESMVEYISPGDLVILGDRENAQEAALRTDLSCLILTGGFEPSAHIRELAGRRNAAIVVTPHDSFATARLINLSGPALRLLEEDVLVVSPDSLVNEITLDLLESKLEIALVVDDDGRLTGVVTKGDIVARRRRRVILVDHSERSQSAEGIERAEILEIIDHHRLGGLETTQPILALIAPVGCTATLLLRRYRDLEVTPPRQMAGLMTAAILSDTMLLKSPTTTAEDIAAVQYLGGVMGEDPLAFGVRMYNAKFDVARLGAEEIVTYDLKRFDFASTKVAIAQVEVGNKNVVLARRDEIVQAMTAYQGRHDLDLMLLMVTEIVDEGTELFAVGRTRLVERALGVSLHDHSVYLPRVLSRKKQIVPLFSALL